MKNIKLLISIIWLLTSSALAEQLNFAKQKKDDHYLFSYQWLDHQNQTQEISFSLSKDALFNRFRTLKSYQNVFAQKAIMRSVREKIKDEPLEGVTTHFVKTNGNITINIEGSEKQNIALANQKIQALENKATQEYLQNNYYQFFNNADNETNIKINHTRIASESVADFKKLKPIILDKVSIKNVRKVTNFILSFVQSIPYNALESRITSSGSGYNAPAKLIWENQGDCDSKVTLMATLLRTLMPRINIAMVFIEKHAFLGIAVASRSDEMTINHRGVNYLLAEPTGPALYGLGKLSPESELAVNQGRYVVEIFKGYDSQ